MVWSACYPATLPEQFIDDLRSISWPRRVGQQTEPWSRVGNVRNNLPTNVDWNSWLGTIIGHVFTRCLQSKSNRPESCDGYIQYIDNPLTLQCHMVLKKFGCICSRPRRWNTFFACYQKCLPVSRTSSSRASQLRSPPACSPICWALLTFRWQQLCVQQWHRTVTQN